MRPVHHARQPHDLRAVRRGDCGRRGSLPVLRRLRHARSAHADPAARGASPRPPGRCGLPRAAPCYFDPGQPFGDRYTVVEEVGSGGMGQVYKAIDRKLGKTVALKLIRPDTAAQQEGLERFRRELALAQEVTHPNVCRVHDLGEVDGVVYISMEYVEGQSLEDLIQSVGHLSPKQTVNIGAAGLRRSPGDPRARHRPPRPQAREHHGGPLGPRAGDGLRHGLPQRAGAPDRRGRGAGDAGLPLSGAGAQPAHRPAVRHLRGRARALRDADRPAAARRPVERSPGPARQRRRAARRRAVSPRRSRGRSTRSSCGAWSATPSAASPPPSRSRRPWPTSPPRLSSGVSGVRPLAHRPRKAWPLVAAVVLAAAASLAGWRWWRDTGAPELPSPVVAVLPLANVGSDPGDEYLGVGIADSLITHLAGLPSVTVVSRSATLESGRRLSGTRALARDLGVTYVVNGGVQRVGQPHPGDPEPGPARRLGGVGGQFEGTFDRFFEMQRRISEDLSEALQVTLTRAARERLARPPAASVDAYADYSKARALLGAARRARQRRARDRGVRGARCARTRSSRSPTPASGRRIGRGTWRPRTRPGPRRAQASITEALRLDPDQPRTRFALALVYQGTGRADAALDELRRVLAQQPANDDAHRLLGDILADRGEWPEAIAELQRAVAIRPDYWRHYGSLGFAYMKTGRYAEAIAAYTRITELQPDNSRGFQMVGFAYQNAGDNRRALENYRRAIELAPDALAYQNMGTDLLRRRAASATPRRPTRRRSGWGRRNPVTHRNLGDAYERLGEAARARQAWRKAVELSEEALQVNPEDAQVLSRIAVYEAKLGRHARGGRVHRPARWPSSRPTATSSIARRWCTRWRGQREAARRRAHAGAGPRLQREPRSRRLRPPHAGAAARVPGARRPGAMRRAAERMSLMRRATLARGRCWRGPAWPRAAPPPSIGQPPAPGIPHRGPRPAGGRPLPDHDDSGARVRHVPADRDVGGHQPGPRDLQAGGRRASPPSRAKAPRARRPGSTLRTAASSRGPARGRRPCRARPAAGTLPVQRHDRRRNRRSRAGGLALVSARWPFSWPRRWRRASPPLSRRQPPPLPPSMRTPTTSWARTPRRATEWPRERSAGRSPCRARPTRARSTPTGCTCRPNTTAPSPRAS